MRIAYLCSDPGIPVFGTKGAAIHLRELTRALAAAGHDLAIWAARAGESPPAGWSLPVTVHATRPAVRLTGGEPDPLAQDVATLHGTQRFRAAVLPELAAFAPDILYERYSLFGTAGAALARALDLPLVLEVNAPLSQEQRRHRGLGLVGTAETQEAFVLEAADRVVAVSEAVAQWAMAHGAAADRTVVVPNGVDLGRFAGRLGPTAARTALGLPEAPTVGFVGSLKAWHGTASLLRAVAALRATGPNVRLVLVGDGPERAGLATLAAELGLGEALTFAGAVPHESVPTWLAAMDVAVAPYDDAADCYFSPLKLFEYMAAGRPIVAAGAGQLAEVLTEGRDALLYPPGDLPALTEALGRLLADPPLAGRLGAAARHTARQRHAWSVVADRIGRLAQDVQAERREPAA